MAVKTFSSYLITGCQDKKACMSTIIQDGGHVTVFSQNISRMKFARCEKAEIFLIVLSNEANNFFCCQCPLMVIYIVVIIS